MRARPWLAALALLAGLALGGPSAGALDADAEARAGALYNESRAHFAQHRYEAALTAMLESVRIGETVYGPDDEQMGLARRALGIVYRALNRDTDAEAQFARSLAILEQAHGPDSPTLGPVLADLASLRTGQGKFAEALPLLTRAVGLLEPRGPGQELAEAWNQLIALYENLDRFAEAEQLAARSLAANEAAFGPDHMLVANSATSLAGMYYQQGRLDDAEALFRRSLAIYEHAVGVDDPSLALTLTSLSRVFAGQGRFPDAEALLQRAIASLEKAGLSNAPVMAATLHNLATLYQQLTRYDEAVEVYNRFLPLAFTLLGENHPAAVTIVSNGANLFNEVGKHEAASKMLEVALEAAVQHFGPDSLRAAMVSANLGAAYRDIGRHAEGERLLRQSLAIHQNLLGRDHQSSASILYNLARLQRAQGRLDAAVEASRASVAVLQRRFAGASGERAGGGGAEQRAARIYYLPHIAIVQAAAPADLLEETFQTAQRAHASGAGRALAGMAARFAAGSDQLAAVVRARQDLVERWQRIDARLVQAAGQAGAARDAAAETALRADLTDAGRQIDALDARIAVDFPGYAELNQAAPVPLAATQALLGADEAMLAYLAGVDESWLWVLTRERAALHRIEIGALPLADEIAALRTRLDPELNPRWEPFDAARAYALHQKILAPATPLLAGKRHVFVVPDAALESLPIGVLVTQPPPARLRAPADHRAVAWFARDHAVTVLPSVGALRALRQFAATARASAPFVGIGNPVLEGQPGSARGARIAGLFRGALADVAQVRQLEPLPETADELRAVAAALGAGEQDLYLGARATEPRLRAAGLERYRIIHFATHGLMSGDLRGLAEPALVLTPPAVASPEDDGLLTASKVATFRLDADWVVLSACNTAAADGTPDGGGLSGLAKAFFYAGARALLVSHWSVPSVTTVALVTTTFAALRQDPSIGRAEALRRAQLAMLRPGLPGQLAHPLAWAPFVVAGEGGAGR